MAEAEVKVEAATKNLLGDPLSIWKKRFEDGGGVVGTEEKKKNKKEYLSNKWKVGAIVDYFLGIYVRIMPPETVLPDSVEILPPKMIIEEDDGEVIEEEIDVETEEVIEEEVIEEIEDLEELEEVVEEEATEKVEEDDS